MSQNNQNAIQLARGTLEQYKFELQKTRILVSYLFLIYFMVSLVHIKWPGFKLRDIFLRRISGRDLEMRFLFKVSQAVQELKQYTEQYQREDPLVVGIPTSMNPFKDKRPCSIL